MKTTIDLPDALGRQAKVLASQEGTTLRELVVSGLEAELRRRLEEGPDEIELPTYGSGGLRPGVAWGDMIETSYDMPA